MRRANALEEAGYADGRRRRISGESRDRKRRRARRRKMCDDLRGRPDSDDALRDDAHDDRRDDCDGECRQHAPRQMLQDFAFGTVVVDRMRRTAGNRRGVEATVVVRTCMAAIPVLVRDEIVNEERQRAERGPGNGDQRAPCNACVPRAGVHRPSPASGAHRLRDGLPRGSDDARIRGCSAPSRVRAKPRRGPA